MYLINHFHQQYQHCSLTNSVVSLTSLCTHTKAFFLLVKSDTKITVKGKQAITSQNFLVSFLITERNVGTAPQIPYASFPVCYLLILYNLRYNTFHPICIKSTVYGADTVEPNLKTDLMDIKHSCSCTFQSSRQSFVLLSLQIHNFTECLPVEERLQVQFTVSMSIQRFATPEIYNKPCIQIHPVDVISGSYLRCNKSLYIKYLFYVVESIFQSLHHNTT
jgi:hypothetical protein